MYTPIQLILLLIRGSLHYFLCAEKIKVLVQSCTYVITDPGSYIEAVLEEESGSIFEEKKVKLFNRTGLVLYFIGGHKT